VIHITCVAYPLIGDGVWVEQNFYTTTLNKIDISISMILKCFQSSGIGLFRCRATSCYLHARARCLSTAPKPSKAQGQCIAPAQNSASGLILIVSPADQTNSELKQERNKRTPTNPLSNEDNKRHPVPHKTKTVTEADAELRERLEQMSGEGGASGIEYEDGKANAMKRGVRKNMFRLI
jgi:hypothetical protein